MTNAAQVVGMTEFPQDLRHYCRNPRCRSKLPSPVSNLREAFCTRGCYESFHLKRCRVCEQPIEVKYRKIKPNGGDRTKFVKVQNSSPTCGSTDCKRRWRQKDGTGRFSAPTQASGYQGSQESNLHQEVPISCGSFGAIQTAAAIVPDGPNCSWEGGEYRRLEAKNRAALREHFRKLADQCLIQPHHPAVNVLGGNKEWRHRVTGEPIFTDLPAVDLSPMRTDWAPCSPRIPVADDLSIPAFLKREPAAVSESPESFLDAAE